MIGLLDINVLVALFDTRHVHHQAAHAWMDHNRSLGWATCPITQNGCIRVVSQSQYPGRLPVPEIVRRLGAATTANEHTFWPDSISLCDAAHFKPERILTAKTITDTYLLALARVNDGRLVTFDRAIPLAAVSRAQTRHLVVL